MNVWPQTEKNWTVVLTHTKSIFRTPISQGLGGTVPWIRPRFCYSQISKRFLFGRTLWIYLPNLKFVALPIPETKKFGQSLDRPTLSFLPKFKGLLFGWTLLICLPNLRFVPLRVPEIIGGYSKNLDSPWIRPRSRSPKFVRGFGCEHICQIWSS